MPFFNPPLATTGGEYRVLSLKKIEPVRTTFSAVIERCADMGTGIRDPV
jgi:hypothetical protein